METTAMAGTTTTAATMTLPTGTVAATGTATAGAIKRDEDGHRKRTESWVTHIKAMVLAAGKGTRLFPLTGVIPKPVAPVAGKPLIGHIFELLARTGVNEVHVNVHYLADFILECYGEETRVDGTEIHFTREEELMARPGASNGSPTASTRPSSSSWAMP